MRVLSRRCARPGALAPSSLVANTLRGLRDVQEVHGNRWSEVARHIGTKTGQQCAQRWRHRVNPNISKCVGFLWGGGVWGWPLGTSGHWGKTMAMCRSVLLHGPVFDPSPLEWVS